MPFTVKQIRCRVDPELDEALFDFQERLGNQYIEAESVLAQLQSIRDSVKSGLTDPLRSNLDRVLAVADTSTEEVEDNLGLLLSDSSENYEASLSERLGVNIINGRIVVEGDTDISALQNLTRLLGTFEEVLGFIPEIEDVPITFGADAEFRESFTISPRFIFVTTYVQTTVTPATKCTPEIVVEQEITAGVDLSIEDAASRAGVSEEDLQIYIFWLGDPDAGPRMRNKARSMGLTNAQFVDAVALSSSEGFTVEKIDDPMDLLRLLIAFGEDIDAVLSRVSGPIDLFPSATDVVGAVRGTFSRSSGAVGPGGFPDFSSPAAALLGAIDIGKAFDLDNLYDQLSQGIVDSDPSLPATQLVSAITGALQSQLQAITALLNQAQGILQGVLVEISNLQSIVFAIFNDLSNGLFDCIFGPDFSVSFGFPDVGIPGSVSGVGGIGGPGTPGTPGVPTDNPLQDLISQIEGQSSLIREFTSTLGDFFGLTSTVSCMGSFLSGSLTQRNRFSGSAVNCVTEQLEDTGFELPEELQDAIGVTKVVMDFVNNLFDFAISNLRGLRLTAVSLGLSIRATLQNRNSFGSDDIATADGGCAPPEAARLAGLLAQRAQAAFTEVGV